MRCRITYVLKNIYIRERIYSWFTFSFLCLSLTTLLLIINGSVHNTYYTISENNIGVPKNTTNFGALSISSFSNLAIAI